MKKNSIHPVVQKLVGHINRYIASGGSYEQLAIEAQISHQTLRNWCSGAVMRPQVPKFAQVCDALGLELDIR